MKHRCITFAGVPGSSKTPIATYLSYTLGLPLFISDAIRTEVKEDQLFFDIPEFDRRLLARLEEPVASKQSFIYDASVDRSWPETKRRLEAAGYSHFVISLDLSRELLIKLYRAKDYAYDQKLFDDYYAQHAAFLEDHTADIGLHITDNEFSERLERSLKAARKWLA